MLFVGIDLAWSEKNSSGIAIIEGDEKSGKLISCNILKSDKEIIDYINKFTKGKEAIISIDAPLVVPNEKGRRFAEELVGILFRKYNAGAHPTNRKRLSSFTGKIRGEEISKLLGSIGFKHNPYIKKFEKTRKFFEVYPHPSMVVLFNLDRILQYKLKPKRDYNFRYEEFNKYKNHLKNLNNPLIKLTKEILQEDITKLKSQKLKDFEDKLDSIFCAYLAYYSWVNPEKCTVLVTLNEGYIHTPIFDYMKDLLKNLKSQKNITDF